MQRNGEPNGRTTAALAAIYFSACGVILAAAGAPKIEIAVQVERELVHPDSTGKKIVERKPVDIANPGDVLVYTLKATNVGEGPALEARLEDPLPPGTELILDSLDHGHATPAASLDGGKTWQPFPARVERRGSDGKVESVPAPADTYTHLRWTLADPLAPGESKNVQFKVRVH